MNSFTLTAVGNLGRNPEVFAKGDLLYTRFLLVGNDYSVRDEGGLTRNLVTSVWFVAFGPIGERAAKKLRKGDQVILEARVQSNFRIDGKGAAQHDYAFVVQDFKYGAPGRATRTESEASRSSAEG